MLIENAVIERLEQASMPENLTNGEAEDEHIEQVEAWIEAHNEASDHIALG